MIKVNSFCLTVLSSRKMEKQRPQIYLQDDDFSFLDGRDAHQATDISCEAATAAKRAVCGLLAKDLRLQLFCYSKLPLITRR
jgi:hypothetical protein